MSASLELGFAVGSRKPTAVYVPGMREPDLMVKMADFVTDDLVALLNWVHDRPKRVLLEHVAANGRPIDGYPLQQA
jgi:hypothetical protein